MSQKLRVTRKAVAAEKKRALINRRGRNCINRTRGAQSDCGFYVTRRRFASRARFNSRLDMSADVIKVKDDRLANHIRQALVMTDYVVAALEVKRARRVRKKLGV